MCATCCSLYENSFLIYFVQFSSYFQWERQLSDQLTVYRFLLLLVVVGGALYSLKKQVCLASREYCGLDFANYIPLV